jgi:hypothetical protein
LATAEFPFRMVTSSSSVELTARKWIPFLMDVSNFSSWTTRVSFGKKHEPGDSSKLWFGTEQDFLKLLQTFAFWYPTKTENP